MSASNQFTWSVGGGKGAVGRSTLTAAMGVALARMGKTVVLVDADLNPGNLRSYLGIDNPGTTLLEVLTTHASIESALLPTVQPGLRLICCTRSSGANLDPALIAQMLESVSSLTGAHVLLDTGSGASRSALGFFNVARHGILVITPELQTVKSAISFLTSALYQRVEKRFGSHEAIRNALQHLRLAQSETKPFTMMDFYELLCTTDPDLAEGVAALVHGCRPLLIINQAGSDQDQRAAEIMQLATRKLLNVDIRFCGLIASDPAVFRSGRQLGALDFEDPEGVAPRQVRDCVVRLLNSVSPEAQQRRSAAEIDAPLTPTMGLNDNLEVMGKNFHIQTEDVGYAGRYIRTQVFHQGKVVLSTRSEYPTTIRDERDRAQVAEIMRRQHFDVIRQIEAHKDKIPGQE